MNPKLRRVLATVGFVFMSLFSVSFIMYLVDNTLFGGRIWAIAMAFLIPGIIIFAAIYITRGFPFQQLKDEEAAKQREEFIRNQATQAQKDAAEDGESDLMTDDERADMSEGESSDTTADGGKKQ